MMSVVKLPIVVMKIGIVIQITTSAPYARHLFVVFYKNIHIFKGKGK